jgi:hypothetical protein
MKKDAAILAFVFPGSDSRLRLRLLRSLLEVASWLDMEIHLAVPRDDQYELQTELETVIRQTRPPSSPVIIHRLANEPLHETVTETVRLTSELGVDYVIIEELDFENTSAEPLRLLHDLLERSPAPVLILPFGVQAEIRSTETFVVPLSGEQRPCQALTHALKLAERTDVSVTLLHVCEPGRSCVCLPTGLESLGDQPHHEYLQMLDKVVSEGSPQSSLRERRRVNRFAHLSGGPPEEIARFMSTTARSLLILEWKGVLMNGHAETLKSVLKSVQAPVLIVKVARVPATTLKMGGEISDVGKTGKAAA